MSSQESLGVADAEAGQETRKANIVVSRTSSASVPSPPRARSGNGGGGGSGRNLRSQPSASSVGSGGLAGIDEAGAAGVAAGSSRNEAIPVPPGGLPKGGHRGRSLSSVKTGGVQNPRVAPETSSSKQVARTFYVDGQEFAAAMSVTHVQNSPSEVNAGGIRVVAHLIKKGVDIEYVIPRRCTDEALRHCSKSTKIKRGIEALIECLELFVGSSGAYELRVRGWVPPEERAEQIKQEATNDVVEMLRAHGLSLNRPG